mmetsp:Transcript_36444/g.60371  ORF Transcript_36444/g.60371 Transcript_36444/m.60371 type:complete len:210 (+) Transcript_36444:137-766(+)
MRRTWVQCEEPLCQKWRVLIHPDETDLKGWTCLHQWPFSHEPMEEYLYDDEFVCDKESLETGGDEEKVISKERRMRSGGRHANSRKRKHRAGHRAQQRSSVQSALWRDGKRGAVKEEAEEEKEEEEDWEVKVETEDVRAGAHANEGPSAKRNLRCCSTISNAFTSSSTSSSAASSCASSPVRERNDWQCKAHEYDREVKIDFSSDDSDV